MVSPGGVTRRLGPGPALCLAFCLGAAATMLALLGAAPSPLPQPNTELPLPPAAPVVAAPPPPPPPPPPPVGAALAHPSSAGCSPTATVAIGILARPNAFGAEARQVIRDSWVTVPHPGIDVVIRFLLPTTAAGEVTLPELEEEARQHGDILFLHEHGPDVTAQLPNGRPNLLDRVRQFFRWAVQTCPKVEYIFKTDDDCFVHLPNLAKLIPTLPRERLYYGRFLRGMPGRKDGDRKKPVQDNYQNMASFPTYAGAGYILSKDVATALGRLEGSLPMKYHSIEDRGIGVMLLNRDVTYIDAKTEFEPWGRCLDSSIWIHHFQKDFGIMRRRAQRVKEGRSACGKGFPDGSTCGSADQGRTFKLECTGGTIQQIEFATYGRYKFTNPGPCSEEPDALRINEECHAPNAKDFVAERCIGKAKCEILNKPDELHQHMKDPCPGYKALIALATCG